MILRSVLSGLAVLGFVACAGAESDAEGDVVAEAAAAAEAVAAPVPTLEDVNAAPEDWREVDPENLVLFNTSKGEILIELLPVAAPTHVERFKEYVRAGRYDNTVFHRVIEDFMAQGGDVGQVYGPDALIGPMEAEFTFRRDPKTTPIDSIGPAAYDTSGFIDGVPISGQGEAVADFSADGRVNSWIPHCPGVLSSARTDDPDSADAQFFIITGDGRHLDKAYTAKGRVVSGLENALAIKLGPEPNGFPIILPDTLISAVMAADLPEEARPTVYVERTDSPDWQARLNAADNKKTDICDLPLPASVVKAPA